MVSEGSDDKADRKSGEERGPEREIKVTDRRMFTPEGELREEYRQVGTPDRGAAERQDEERRDEGRPESGPIVTPGGAPTGEERPPSAPTQSEPAGGAPVDIPRTGAGPAPSFLDLVGLLAEPVPLYLGDAELPDGRTVENLEAARLHIDLLDVLHRKTAGNLTTQESAVLEDVIYRLRMRYVQKRG